MTDAPKAFGMQDPIPQDVRERVKEELIAKRLTRGFTYPHLDRMAGEETFQGMMRTYREMSGARQINSLDAVPVLSYMAWVAQDMGCKNAESFVLGEMIEISSVPRRGGGRVAVFLRDGPARDSGPGF
jgi:hypothetical protein